MTLDDFVGAARERLVNWQRRYKRMAKTSPALFPSEGNIQDWVNRFNAHEKWSSNARTDHAREMPAPGGTSK